MFFIVIALSIKCSAHSLQAIAPLFDLMIYFYAFDILGNQCTQKCTDLQHSSYYVCSENNICHIVEKCILKRSNAQGIQCKAALCSKRCINFIYVLLTKNSMS